MDPSWVMDLKKKKKISVVKKQIMYLLIIAQSYGANARMQCVET